MRNRQQRDSVRDYIRKRVQELSDEEDGPSGHGSSPNEVKTPRSSTKPRITEPDMLETIPKARHMRYEDWVPGKTTRTAYIDKDGIPHMREEVEEGNLVHMSHISDNQYADAKDARQTMERMKAKSEDAMYLDRSQQRSFTERMKLEHDNKKYLDRQRQRLSEERMAMNEQTREYADRIHQRRSQINLEHDRQMHEQQMASMQYQDRSHQRNNEYAIHLGRMRLENDDRSSHRKHIENMAALDRIEELSRARETALDNAQRRLFNDLDFRDYRVGRHERFVKLEKEQSGLNRRARVMRIFEEMGLGDPDDIDLNERRVSGEVKLLERRHSRSYLYSILLTGVESVMRTNPNSPVVEFLDKTRLQLPQWNNGYLIQDEHIDTGVWLIHVYKAPHKMLWIENEKSCKHDGDRSKSCCMKCCETCNLQ